MSAAATGIPGLDDILGGGLPANHLYLLEGDPGAGKTTLALQFLLEGRRRGERGLYITLSETAAELRSSAGSHGWSLDGVDVFELNSVDPALLDNDVSLFHPGEIQLGEAMRVLLDQVERCDPQRVVFDSLSEIRLLAQQQLRYRRQILALKHHFANKNCTALLLDDRTSEPGDKQLMSIAHGVLMLEQTTPVYGSERRRLRVAKLRGHRYRGGYHDYVIRTGGLEVFPRLVASEHRDLQTGERASSGNAEFDQMLRGGLTRGTSTLLMGPPGSGKSSLLSTFAVAAAAQRGERSVLYIFDENISSYLMRSRSMGLPLEEHWRAGLIRLEQIDPAELCPGEFVSRVRQDVDSGARLIGIDSLGGYLNSMPEEHFLVNQLHELLSYLAQSGVMSFLILPQQGLVGTSMSSPVDVSYLADCVVLLRFFESEGAVRNALSVMKHRTGAHEKTIRELVWSSSGFSLGPALTRFEGVLSGIPRLRGKAESSASETTLDGK